MRSYTAEMLKSDVTPHQADLLASLVEEEDWTASLGETLFQIARRAEREKFGPQGQELLNAILDEVAVAMRAITPNADKGPASAADRLPAIQKLRDLCLKTDLPWSERGAILTLLGSAERAFYLVERIDAERRSVSRVVPSAVTRPDAAPGGLGSAVPAE
jgi:phosphate:Na+ symporter